MHTNFLKNQLNRTVMMARKGQLLASDTVASCAEPPDAESNTANLCRMTPHQGGFTHIIHIACFVYALLTYIHLYICVISVIRRGEKFVTLGVTLLQCAFICHFIVAAEGGCRHV